ncbi:universal stress protein [Natronorubrum thiooxidans]|uniref:Nucleotide-binding universal stress protein, UspA family n=1 Tax=Natronorubrum thiooxidans TaxID=308853 RepID=A0A1N7DEA1_9EURY|nr:universal stress protein [Natronorubrum thiooxidans]SIR74132.1 Nucleotide-binding universal stress protein, UspA family [Natronorubrum thiooxidans]
MYESILVATDGSEAAHEAVSHAVELARRFDATLYGIAVLETRTEYDNAIVDPEKVRHRQREQALEALEALEAAADDAGVTVETTIRSGVPYETILAYADEQDASAIVLGARGRSSFRRALLGSTADRVVRSTTRPVLLIDETD